MVHHSDTENHPLPATAPGLIRPGHDPSHGPVVPSEEPGRAAEPVSLPGVSLPKGGGAIRGIDEKFAVNRATGTASLSIPIATSAGRAGFGPSLALEYDSGAGNGPFGLGWSLA